jgi:hypothetical protein
LVKICSIARRVTPRGRQVAHRDERAARSPIAACESRRRPCATDPADAHALPLVFEPPGARNAQQRIDDRRGPRHRRAQKLQRFADIAVEHIA